MKSHPYAHYTLHIPKLFDYSNLSFILLLLDRSRKSSPLFEVALICSLSSSGRGGCGVEGWADTEQPSKRKLSQSRELLAPTLMSSTSLSPTWRSTSLGDASLCEWGVMANNTHNMLSIQSGVECRVRESQLNSNPSGFLKYHTWIKLRVLQEREIKMRPAQFVLQKYLVPTPAVSTEHIKHLLSRCK